VTESAIETSLYLYALVDHAGGLTGQTGIEGSPVFAVTHGRVSALLGPLKSTRLRPERRNVMAHQKVLASVNDGRAILPMRFGLVVSSEDEVASLLEQHQDNLVEQLQRVRGRIELGLRICWKEDQVFANLMSIYPALEEARRSAPKTREGLIDIGQRVATALTTQRNSIEAQTHAALTDCVGEFAFNAPKSDAQLLNAACLVDRANVPQFESAVNALGATLDDRYTIDFNGPWAPHNFIKLNLAF